MFKGIVLFSTGGAIGAATGFAVGVATIVTLIVTEKMYIARADDGTVSIKTANDTVEVPRDIHGV